MCHEPDSAPPIPRVLGAAVSHENLILEAVDGNRFASFAASPDEPGGAGVVILPDVRGLYRFYEELALRFAERGHTAVAIDYFGRTADVGKRDDDFEFMPHVEQTTFHGLQADIGAAVARLREHGCRTIFTVGFCFGGRLSWVSTAETHDLSGAIGFYGRTGSFADGTPGPLERVRELRAPILALMGGNDAAIPVAEAEAFDRALDKAGVEHDVVVYPGAPHSFFDRKYEEFAEASANAWQRVLAFVERHSR